MILGICLLFACCTACQQAPQQNDPPVMTENTEPSVATGGTGHCEVHDEQYHLLSASLTDLLDQEEFQNWSKRTTEASRDIESDCPYSEKNMKTFIDYFQIPRETFEEYCNSRWDSLHNIDLLYSDDMEAIEAYYRDVEKRQITHNKQESFHRVKTNLINKYHNIQEIIAKSDEEKTDVETEVEFHQKISMFRIIQLFQPDRAIIDEIIQQEKEEFYWNSNHYDYQFDLVYNEDGTLKDFTIDPDKTVVELDAQFAGVDNFFTDY
ncbi:MAG: hypothetical protein HFE77_06235 [Clostridiales bacterium]|nr:hypothetical protein [Clostridiales bacterium]